VADVLVDALFVQLQRNGPNRLRRHFPGADLFIQGGFQGLLNQKIGTKNRIGIVTLAIRFRSA
jgi:hypothetical protein